MAVRKINESTLTDIADAIRSKTGGSALINPEDMASEIGSISTGGGSPWELIADTTSDAIATVVTAEIPSIYQTANVYKVQISAEFSVKDYPYFGINGSYSSYDVPRDANTPWVFIGYVVKKETNGTPIYVLVISTKIVSIDSNTVESISLKAYYADKIKAGCNIKVWRLVE